MNILIIILFLALLKINNIKLDKITIIEKKLSFSNSHYYDKQIDKYFIIFHAKNRRNIKISKDIYFIEHNYIYDDFMFLIPLFKNIIKTKVVAICSDENNSRSRIKSVNNIKNFTIYNECIYFDIYYLKYLQIHSRIFRFCTYKNVLNILYNNYIIPYIEYYNICREYNYSYNYSIITTVYKRNNLKQQINLFLNQSIPPKNIIVVHDRNLIKIPYNDYDIIYFHTINFPAGFYFRYLIAILSPENDVIIYDDDWFPYNKNSHLKWINKINSVGNGFFGHHSASKNGIRWCATPLIIHRNLLFLMWLNEVYEVRAAEDGHLSFSVLLLCNIKCKTERMHGLNYKYDKLSSSGINITKSFWKDYTYYISQKINSTYILSIKNKYKIK